MVITGTYEHTIDAKNRLAIPSDVRNTLRWLAATPESPVFLYVTLGEGGMLYLWDEKAFEKRADELDQSELDAEELLEYERIMYSLARRVEMDKQGRIRLPEHLLKMSKLGTDVAVIGVKDHLEVHDRAAWQSYVERTITDKPQLLRNPRAVMRHRKPQPDAAG